MRRTQLLLLLVMLAASPTARAQSQAAPCSAPEYHQFDFWVGDWDVKTPDGKPAGTNSITRPLGDCVLQEHWVGAKGGRGESYNIYDRVGGHWHQTWVDKQGTYLALEGGLVGDAMVLQSAERSVGGKPTIDRITWTPKGEDVHQVWDQSNDAGKSWTTVFHGIYHRTSGAK